MTPNWDAIGAIAEALGAVGVIVTLAYLAAQIRQNNRSLRAATHQTITENSQTLSFKLVDDPSLAELVLKGNTDYASLSGVERFRFDQYVERWFETWENVFYQRSQGMIEDRMWEAIDRFMRRTAALPGFSEVWHRRKELYHDDFQTHVDGGGP